MLTHYFPLSLTSTKKSIKLTDSIFLLRFDHPRVRRLIGIEDIAVSEIGHTSAISYKTSSVWPTWWIHLRSENPTHNFRNQLCNFVLATSTREEAILVAFALKLMGGTLSGPFVGFSEGGNSVQFLRFRPWWGKDFLKLESPEIKLLRKLVADLSAIPITPKLSTIMEIYRYAESADVPTASLRYLQLAIILEMLFLPQKASELGYRFQLRVAKWFHRFYKEDPKTIASIAATIYKIRSTVAHKGVAIVTDEDMNNVRDITRRALRYFVIDPSVFTDTFFDSLCLKG